MSIGGWNKRSDDNPGKGVAQISDLRLYDHFLSREDMEHYRNCTEPQNSTDPVLTMDSDLLKNNGSEQLTSISENQVCAPVSPLNIYFNKKLKFKKALEWCSQLGGSLPLPEDSSINEYFYSQSHQSVNAVSCDTYSPLYWLGIEIDNSSRILKLTDGKAVEWNAFPWWYIKYKYIEPSDCTGVANKEFNMGLHWYTYDCENVVSCGVLCTFEHSTSLKLQVKCDSFELNTKMIISKSENGSIQLFGQNYRLIYDNGFWTISSTKGERTRSSFQADMIATAEMEIPLGRHMWTVWGTACNQMEVSK